MSITIEISPEIEARLREQAAQQGAKLEEYLGALAQQWAGGNGLTGTKLPEPQSAEEWIKEWRAWAASHKGLPVVLDDSRESIYAGCGE